MAFNLPSAASFPSGEHEPGFPWLALGTLALLAELTDDQVWPPLPPPAETEKLVGEVNFSAGTFRLVGGSADGR